MIATNLGDQPHDILRGAADEVLACLKNDAMTDPERKRETEKLINSVTPEVRQPGSGEWGKARGRRTGRCADAGASRSIV